jgi:DNA polymerase-3 subunit delta
MTPEKKQSAKISPIYVIYGKDRRSALDHLHRLTEQVLAGADPLVAMNVYDQTPEWADVNDALGTLPFLSERRLVVIKDADEFIKQYRSRLEEYADAPSETGVLILMPESFPKTTRLAKRVSQIGAVIACEPVKPRQLHDFLMNYAKQSHQIQLTRPAAAMLIELGGDDAGLLVNEVDKLVAYVTAPEINNKQVDVDDVQAIVGQNRQFNVFNVIDAMTVSQSASALQRLEQMLRQDRDAQFTVVGAFAWHFRRLYKARVLMDKGMAPGAINKELRIWSQPDQFIGQVKRLNLMRIGAILRELMVLDWHSKTSSAAVQLGLEKLIVKFCPTKT